MQTLMYLLFLGAAFLAYKRRTTLWTACAAALFTAAFNYQEWDNSWIWPALVVGLIVLTAKSVASSVRAQIQADTKEAVSFTIGEIISNSNDTLVTTSVSVGRDAFGDAKATTSHDYHSSHTTWIKDLMTGKEAKIGGDGHLEARSGHVVGFARYKGRTMMDINYTTEKVFAMKGPNVAINAAIIILGGLLLGWVLYPVMLLCTLLASRWPNTWSPKGGGAITPGFAGSALHDKLYIVGGFLCYGLAFLTVVGGHGAASSFILAGLLLVVGVVVLPVYCLIKLRDRHAQLMIYCEQQLDRLLSEAKARSAARAQHVEQGAPAAV